MSFIDDMFWNTKTKHKKVNDNRLRVTIPDTTNLWNPTSEAAGVREEPAPYVFKKVSGDFQVTVKISGEFNKSKDQAGILLKQTNKFYFRCGIEVHNKADIVLEETMQQDRVKCVTSCVVNHKDMDWSCFPTSYINGSIGAYWVSVKRQGNVVMSYFSTDGEIYKQLRVAYVPFNEKVSVGLYGATVWAESLKVYFESFEVEGVIDDDDYSSGSEYSEEM